MQLKSTIWNVYFHANALNKRNNLKMILKLVTIIFMTPTQTLLTVWEPNVLR